MEDTTKVFIEDLEETELRLHTFLRSVEERYDQFKKKPKRFDKKGWEEYNESRRQYTYYQGKFYAYFFVLEKMGSNVPSVLRRLRGIGMTSSKCWETKMHYTEVYGHFPSDDFLDKEKVKK